MTLRNEERSPLKCVIVGSCVSRDTVTEAGGRLEVVKYIARHSLISAETNARLHLPQRIPLESAFQRRTLEDDARGELLQLLAPVVGDADVILWDLTDERHGCVRFDDGTYLTRSVELLGSDDMSEVLASGETLTFGTDDHYFRWVLAADRFVDQLRALGAFRKTILLRVPWAEHDELGRSTPTSMGRSAMEANREYSRYYDHLNALGIRVVVVDEPIADSGHRWGPAPFHYAEWVYESVVRQVLGVASLRDPDSER